MNRSRHQLSKCIALATICSAIGGTTFAQSTPEDATSFWEIDTHTWVLDAVSDTSGSITGTRMNIKYDWTSGNQRGDLAYATDPVVFRNWELEHPTILSWRLNRNSITGFVGTASGKDLEQHDPVTNRRFFEIDNSTGYLGVDARYWILPSFFVDAGIVASVDKFKGREDLFVHERTYNDLSGNISWGMAEFRMDTANSILVGPENVNGVFIGPSPLSGSSYTFSNAGPVSVRIPNGDSISISALNAGSVDVDISNGDDITVTAVNTGSVVVDVSNGDRTHVATDSTGPVSVDTSNGDSVIVIARYATSLDIDTSNGDELQVYGIDAGRIEVDASNGDAFTVLAMDSDDILVEASNGQNGRVEALRSGDITVLSGGPAHVAAELSGTTTTDPVTSVSGTVSSTFSSEIETVTDRLPEAPAETGTAVLINLPSCSLALERAPGEVQLTAASEAALDTCVSQFLADGDLSGFSSMNSVETTFFDDEGDEISGKARFGYRGTGFLLGRLSHPIVESVSGGLTFDTSPQGNGIGRTGSWVDASYAVGIQLHSSPRREVTAETRSSDEDTNGGRIGNPFPRFLELRSRYVREIGDFQTSWTEYSMGLHGSFGLRNPDSSSKIRHYSFGYDYISFSENRGAENTLDFRLNHKQKGFGVAFLSVDLVVFRKSAVKFSYTRSKVEFEGLRSKWQDRFGITWRGNL